MEEKSSLYIVAIVGIIAVVALVIMVMGAGRERVLTSSGTATDMSGAVRAVATRAADGGAFNCFMDCMKSPENPSSYCASQCGIPQ